MEKRKQFTFYESFYKALVKLPLEDAQQGAWAIINYALFGVLPEMELSPAVDAVLEMALPVLDSARKKAQGALNSHKVRKTNKDSVRIDDGCGVDAVREKENENEVEVEIEKELEKESLLHTGSGPVVCVQEQFDLFWEAYPLKLGKKQAWYIWKKDQPEQDTVMTALAQWKRSKKWQAENGRYIPRAEKFLEEKHYEQPPKEAVPMGASGYLGKAELEAIERLMNGTD